ncbi:MAG: SdpI family protein [Flavobacteriales bacterium]
MLKFPPKKINALYGYRTLASMRSEEAWRFAQKFSARRMILVGGFSAILTVIVGLLDLKEPWVPLISLSTLIGGFIYLFRSVEKKLAQRFPRS